MSKNKKLLQTVDVFYKLSMFGDRSSFLKSLAQQQPTKSLTPDMKERIESLIKDLGATRPDGSRKQQISLMNLLSSDNVDLNTAYQAVVDASNALPGNNATQVQRALDLAKDIRELNTPTAVAPKEEVMQMPAAQIKGYRPISTELQKQLSDLNVMLGFGMPLQIDGRLGPETMKALKSFRDRIGTEPEGTGQKMSPTASVPEILARVQKEHREKNPTDFSWADKANQRKEDYYKSQATPPGVTPNKV